MDKSSQIEEDKEINSLSKSLTLIVIKARKSKLSEQELVYALNLIWNAMDIFNIEKMSDSEISIIEDAIEKCLCKV